MKTETRYTYYDKEHGSVKLSIAFDNAGETYPVLEVNGIEIGHSATQALARFFKTLPDEIKL